MCVVELETGVVVGDACPGISAENPAAAAALSRSECDADAGRKDAGFAPLLPLFFKNGTKSDGIFRIGCLI